MGEMGESCPCFSKVFSRNYSIEDFTKSGAGFAHFAHFIY